MIERIAWAPALMARISGFFYLGTFVAGGVAQAYIGKHDIVGDVAANVATLCYVAVVLLFYGLFRAVSPSISLLAAAFGLVGCSWGLVTTFQLNPWHINSLVFFGFYCLLIGYLIWRSTFLPHVLGLLMAFAGLGWLTFAFPDFARSLSPYNLGPGVLGEGALLLWLLAKAVNVPKWYEQAGASGTSRPTAAERGA